MNYQEKLRIIAEHSTPDKAEVLTAAADRLENLEKLTADFELIAKWREEWEKLFERKCVGVMFSIGGWWADRPWRKDRK